jgi:hypothetical protein
MALDARKEELYMQAGKTKINGKSFCQWVLRTIAAAADEGSLVTTDRPAALGIVDIRNAASFVQQQLSADVVGAYLTEGSSCAGTAEPFAACFARAEHDATASLATLFDKFSVHARALMAAPRLPVSATMRLCAHIVLHPPLSWPPSAALGRRAAAVTVALGTDGEAQLVAFTVADGELSSEYRSLSSCLFVLSLELAPSGASQQPAAGRVGCRALRIPRGETIADLALYGSNAAAIVTTVRGAHGSRLALIDALDGIAETYVRLGGHEPLLSLCMQVWHAASGSDGSHLQPYHARRNRRYSAQMNIEAVDVATQTKSRALHAGLEVTDARLIVNAERSFGLHAP